MATARSYLVLGRVSNLSTVWSNCLCAWLLSGGGELPLLLVLMLALTLIYVGGMYQNDYCDIVFDRQFRPERPIPSGQISRHAVLVATIGLFAAGLLVLLLVSHRAAAYGLGLVALATLYNLIHKKSALGIVIMASCRFAIYPIVAVVALNGLSAQLWIAASIMAAYILSVTLLAKGEAKPSPFAWTKALLLGIPLAVVANQNLNTLGWSAVATVAVAAWIAYVFYAAKRSGTMIIGKAIGPLLAGICLLDLAILASFATIGWAVAVGFIAFFVAALLAQKSIPAS